MTAPIGIKDLLAFEARIGHALKLEDPFWATHTVTPELQLQEGEALTAERITSIYESIPSVDVHCALGEIKAVESQNHLFHTPYIKSIFPHIRGSFIDLADFNAEIMEFYVTKTVPDVLDEFLELARLCDYLGDDSLLSELTDKLNGPKGFIYTRKDIEVISEFVNLQEGKKVLSPLIGGLMKKVKSSPFFLNISTEILREKPKPLDFFSNICMRDASFVLLNTDTVLDVLKHYEGGVFFTNIQNSVLLDAINVLGRELKEGKVTPELYREVQQALDGMRK